VTNEKWNKAGLCVSSTAVSAATITERLGLTPSSSYERGDPIRSAGAGSPVREQSHWVLSSELPTDTPLEEHLESLLSMITGKESTIALLSRECDIYFQCGFASESGQGSVSLEKGLLERIAGIGAAVVLDLYPPESV